MIFTIGYRGLQPSRLGAIREALDADLVDVRAKPASRNASYRKSALERQFGADYVSRTDLGGMGFLRQAGVDWLRGKKRNSLLMCMCGVPGECHRHALITGPHFPSAIHIFEDQLIVSADLQAAFERNVDEYEVLDGSIDDILDGRTKPVDLLP